MDEKKIAVPSWLPELMDQFRQELAKRAEDDVDCRPLLLQERAELDDKIDGWRQSLGNPKLAAPVWTLIASDLALAVERQQSIDAILAEKQFRDLQAETIIQPEHVQKRLARLADVLAANNPTMGNLELSLYIDRITCYPDGKVTLRTCKLGIAPDAVELLADEPTETAAGQQKSSVKGVPRRRNKLRVSGVSADEADWDSLGYFATATERFAGVDDSFFWVDTFQVPDAPVPWYIKNAEVVFTLRQKEMLSYDGLVGKFGKSKPTMMAACKHYLKTHPGAVDNVKLSAGGSRRKRIDVRPIADEVRRLWWDEGSSKLDLADKYHCPSTAIDRALTVAYAKTGEKVPTEEQRRQYRRGLARKLLLDGEYLEEIARTLHASEVTVRTLLKESFAADGKPMPDLRRRSREAS
jgi:hypothetical protein